MLFTSLFSGGPGGGGRYLHPPGGDWRYPVPLLRGGLDSIVHLRLSLL